MVDLGHLLRGAAHEEERDAEEGGGGQHRHGEARDGLQREAHLLHDDSAHQHPHGYCWQINGAWEPHRPDPVMSGDSSAVSTELIREGGASMITSKHEADFAITLHVF